MQNKGIVKFIALMLMLVCIFYLSFSFVTRHYENKAAAMGEEAGQEYLDSIMNEKVYFGAYSYKECREMQIGLGLDLKGGMNVILEVSVPDVIAVLADHKTDAAFTKSMQEAKKEEETSQKDFVSLFIQSYKKNAPGHRLAEVFATQQMKGKVSTQSSDAEVEAAVRAEVQSAVDNSFLVVRNRIDKFGVVQPNIQKLEGQSGRIMVEMPGIREPERVRKLLQGSANLEFWETYNSQEIVPLLSQINQKYALGADAAVADTTATEAAVDSTATAAASEEKTEAADGKKSLAEAIGAKKDAKADKNAAKDAQLQKMKEQNPLFSIFQPSQGQSLSVVGYATARDTAEVDKIIYSEIAKRILPSDVKLLWSAKAADFDKKGEIFELHALKVTEPSGRAPLEGDVITNAKDEFDQYGHPCVSMQMNSDGARRWAQLTKQNIGRAVAIVLDDAVYSAPRVNGEIAGGNSQITGNFSIEDTKDLANTLNSGKMPAPTRIVQEEVVGPSLGAQSIQQGVISFIVAFILLMVYMLCLYGVIPGMMANIALLFNLFFTLGILTSFQAALTMPGIAGIVLSLGMAVDANVLIFERCKEELRNGKNLKAAVADGYKNAFSAIFDGNLTSIITGAILAAQCTGPVHGFAITLIVGICCSFFTAVFVTRLVLENFLNKNRFGFGTMTFTTNMVKNFLQNTKFDFVSKRGKTSVVVLVVAAVIIAMFFIRPLNLGIDFSGGRNYIVKFEKAVNANELDKLVKAEFGGDVTSSVITIDNDQTVRVSTNYKVKENTAKVDEEIQGMLFKVFKPYLGNLTEAQFSNNTGTEGDASKLGIVSVDAVGPSIADDMTREAVWAVFWSLVAMALYILLRFRNWAFSLGAVSAVALTSFIVIGFFTLHGLLPFSMEVDQTFIAAILTVIGYQINDTVVVFDRVREYRQLFPKQDLKITFNNALNSTLSRTMMTSLSTLLVLVVIFLFGGESIRAFNFAMILGVVFGTCASLFVAAPTAYALIQRSERKAK